MKKTQYLILGIAFVGLLIFSGVIDLSPLGNGSGWEFDYALQYVTVNGDGVSVDSDTEQTADSPTGTTDATSGGSNHWMSLTSLISASAYSMHVDPDGPPVANFFVRYFEGLAPDVLIDMSQVWRVNENYDTINMGDPCEDARNVGDETWYVYLYAFSIYLQTQSQQFTAVNQYNQPYTTAEAGEVDGYFDVEVRLQETVFGAVEGEFMSATILHTETNLDELMSGDYSYAVTPTLSVPPDNTAVEIRDRVDGDDSYHCLMRFPFSMQNGLTRVDVGQNHIPADVWISFVVVTELLLKEPLEIGNTGAQITGGLPPDYEPPFDWRLVALCAFGFIVLVVILYFWSRTKSNPSINVNLKNGRTYR